MSDLEVDRLLRGAAEAAEAAAPPVDPLTALAGARRRRDQRRGHLAALAFVASVVLLQLLPAEALGASRPAPGTAVVVAAAMHAPSAATVPRG